MGGDGGRLLADRFELFEQIGRGGAGQVYRAHDHRLDRPVAVKLLTDVNDTALERFRREAATAARVQHPHVVTLHDAGVDGETPFLVMRLIEGPSLADRVSEQGPLDVEAARRLARDLLEGLEATHQAGVLHRDLTPRNVLFDTDGSALLADFGIARSSADTTLTAAHTVVGTRPFLAPERLRGHAATAATDLFAVGVTLQYAITGRHDLPVPSDHLLAPLITALTAPDPESRPASARTAADRLAGLGRPDDELPDTAAVAAEEATTRVQPLDDAPTSGADRDGGGGPETAPTATPRGESGPSRERRRTVVLATVAAVALAGALVAVATSEDPGAPQEAGTAPSTATPTDDAPTDDDPPGYDADNPAGSARELAEWLREHG